jgi:three-Cys-motif partner protein
MQGKTDVKKTMHLHSEAKVEFYQRYLERYLRILLNSPWIQEINIFDVFCGTGIYDNGKKGSPIVALDAINALGDSLQITNPIRLVVNDEKSDKVTAVQGYFAANDRGYCTVEFNNKTADEMFKQLLELIPKQSKAVRNLIFIDPYGYK